MVASVDLVMDLHAFDSREKRGGAKEIVNSPTSVILPCVEAVAPPGIFDRLGV